MTFPQDITSLHIPPATQRALIGKGVFRIEDITDTCNANLNLKELTTPPNTNTALHCLEEQKSLNYVYTFIDNLDLLLKGVLRDGLITELVGLPGCGRTQLCLHLLISAQVVESKVEAETIYICTNMKFSISKLRDITASYIDKCSVFIGHNIDDILKNVNYISILKLEELRSCLNQLRLYLSNQKNVKLVIINSITFLLRQVESTGRTEVISFLFSVLRKLAVKHKFTVVLTNDMTTIVDGPGESVQVPSLKGTFYHMVNSRVKLMKKEMNFQAEILKSSARFPGVQDFFFLS